MIVCFRAVLLLPFLSVTRPYRVSSKFELYVSEKSVLKDALLTFFIKESSGSCSSLGSVDRKDGSANVGSEVASVSSQSSDSSSNGG